MPGIAGIFGPSSAQSMQARLAVMLSVMRHDKTWATGSVCDNTIGLAAGWVLRPGSFALEQCQWQGTPDRALVFCGECDTGTVAARGPLDAYALLTDAFLPALNGLFSGLILDRKRGIALLFNDRYGGERLYMHRHGEELLFASEAKALLAVAPAAREFDERAVADYLAFGSVLGDRTLFRNVTLLPGGSSCLLSGRGQLVKMQRYFTPGEWENLSALNAADYTESLRSALADAILRSLRDHRNVGVSLTAGLDTRMIMACLPAHRMPAVTYTYASPGVETVDCRLAAQVAEACALPHRVLRLDGEFFSQFDRLADETVYLSDGSASVLTTHELPLSQAAARLAPIRLTGNFGSEVLRSVSTFKPLGLASLLLSPDWAASVREAVQQAQADAALHPVTHAAFREIPWHLYGPVAVARTQLQFRTPFLDNEIVRLAYQAPAAARASSLPSAQLIERCNPALARIATDRGVLGAGGALRRALRRHGASVSFKLDYWRTEGVPNRLAPFAALIWAAAKLPWMGRHRFLTYRRWFRHELAAYAAAAADRATRQTMPWIADSGLRTITAQHQSGRIDGQREIGIALTLAAVERLLLRGRYPQAASVPPLIESRWAS